MERKRKSYLLIDIVCHTVLYGRSSADRELSEVRRENRDVISMKSPRLLINRYLNRGHSVSNIKYV